MRGKKAPTNIYLYIYIYIRLYLSSPESLRLKSLWILLKIASATEGVCPSRLLSFIRSSSPSPLPFFPSAQNNGSNRRQQRGFVLQHYSVSHLFVSVCIFHFTKPPTNHSTSNAEIKTSLSVAAAVRLRRKWETAILFCFEQQMLKWKKKEQPFEYLMNVEMKDGEEWD